MQSCIFAFSADPFVIDNDFRHEVLLSHFVRNRLYDADLTNGRVLTMADNKTKATITRKGSKYTFWSFR